MEPKDLVKVWEAPDHSRLTPKQISIRLPILVAAKISALQDMYPNKSKTQIIGDLLATALDQLEAGLPSKRGALLREEIDDYTIDPDLEIDHDLIGKTVCIYEDVGLKGDFRRITKKYLRKMEKELKIEEPMRLQDPIIVGDEEG